MNRTNFAPTLRTITVALVLMLIGLLATYGTIGPDILGIAAFVAAGVLLLAGMLLSGL